jgi:hypothetical protein
MQAPSCAHAFWERRSRPTTNCIQKHGSAKKINCQYEHCLEIYNEEAHGSQSCSIAIRLPPLNAHQVESVVRHLQKSMEQV